MRLSATFPLMHSLALPRLGGASARPTAPVAERAVAALAPDRPSAVVTQAPARTPDDLDLDQRVRLSGEW